MKTPIIYQENNHAVPPLRPGDTVLPKGSVQGPGNYPLPCHIRCMKDVALTLRDGVTIYTDVFLPADCGEAVPAIVLWCPYNKEVHGLPFPWYVPAEKLSGLQRFEGLDPGYWCAAGYAVLHPNARGAGNSGGKLAHWGTQEATDAYDFIEWAAAQSWCSGKVAMAGSSWLSIIQWYTAALRPPHLAAIAPWEGHYDGYRHSTFRGGICTSWKSRLVFEKMVQGLDEYESLSAMADKYPLCDNDYWQDKIARVGDIRTPAYVVASYTNEIHTHGTFDAWCDLGTDEKWLRVHNRHEWIDLYDNQPDLQRFFDHYLKGIANDWPDTPKVRLSVLDPAGTDVTDRPEADFPLPRTRYTPLYLHAGDGSLSPQPDAPGGEVRLETGEQLAFDLRFTEDTELTGYMKLRLWVRSEAHDDMDVFVHVLKLDASGAPAYPIVRGAVDSGPNGKPFIGPFGGLRASLRALDTEKSQPHRPALRLDTPQPLIPGEPVALELPLSPMGMRYKAGETLRLVVSTVPLDLPPESISIHNQGAYTLLTGGEHDACLQVPVV